MDEFELEFDDSDIQQILGKTWKPIHINPHPPSKQNLKNKNLPSSSEPFPLSTLDSENLNLNKRTKISLDTIQNDSVEAIKSPSKSQLSKISARNSFSPSIISSRGKSSSLENAEFNQSASKSEGFESDGPSKSPSFLPSKSFLSENDPEKRNTESFFQPNVSSSFKSPQSYPFPSPSQNKFISSVFHQRDKNPFKSSVNATCNPMPGINSIPNLSLRPNPRHNLTELDELDLFDSSQRLINSKVISANQNSDDCRFSEPTSTFSNENRLSLSTSALRRKLPGPAGEFQSSRIKSNDFLSFDEDDEDDDQTNFEKKNVHSFFPNFDVFCLPTWKEAMNYLKVEEFDLDRYPILSPGIKSIKSSLDLFRIPRLIGMVTNLHKNGFGDLSVTLKDPSGSIEGVIHRKVFDKNGQNLNIFCNTVLILSKVVIFIPRPGVKYLNITKNNIIKVFDPISKGKTSESSSNTSENFKNFNNVPSVQPNITKVTQRTLNSTELDWDFTLD